MTAVESAPSVKLAVPQPVWVSVLEVPSEQVALQEPETGQLQPVLQETLDGTKSQVRPETLFVVRRVPPLRVRLDREVPVTVIAETVEVV